MLSKSNISKKSSVEFEESLTLVRREESNFV